MTLFDSLRIGDRSSRGVGLTAHIDDDWGIVYAQGGVVVALMLRAAEMVLDRPDLRPVAANAVFLRPVRCGEISLEVEVLRSGRSGAQTRVTVHDPADHDPTDHDPTPNLQVTLVCAVHDPTFPTFDGITSPFDAGTPAPLDCPRIGIDTSGHPHLGFIHRTDWRDATPSAAEVVGSITSPTLDLSLQFHTPARGRWVGIDSRCSRSDGGIIAGVATLWNTDGSLIATAAQTALLRRLPRTD